MIKSCNEADAIALLRRFHPQCVHGANAGLAKAREVVKTTAFKPMTLIKHTHAIALLRRFHPECVHGANAGLAKAREVLEPIKARFPWISYADLWTLGGVVAIESMGGE